MQRIVSTFLLIAFLNLEVGFQFAQTLGDGAKQLPANNVSRSVAPQSPVNVSLGPGKRANRENRIRAISLTDTIPPASISVLSNALGDMNADAALDVRDLLRLRDIVVGRPPVPTAYELAEGDLNGDLAVNQEDLNVQAQVLARQYGIPHLIDSIGGIVQGDGVDLVIPAGSLGSGDIVTTRRVNGSELNNLFGINPSGEIQDENYLMGAFEIQTERGGAFQTPFQIEVRLDSIPPCRFDGLNGLFEVLDDMDGDGRSEMVLRNLMHPSADSAYIVADSIPKPVLLTSSGQASRQTVDFGTVAPGATFDIDAINLPRRISSLLVRFEDIDGNIAYFPCASFLPEFSDSGEVPTGVRAFVPPLPVPGLTKVSLFNQINRQTSEVAVLQIAALVPQASFASDTVLAMFSLFDSLISIGLECDSIRSLYPPLTENLTVALLHARSSAATIKANILSSNSLHIQRVAGMITNAGLTGRLRFALRIIDSVGCASQVRNGEALVGSLHEGFGKGIVVIGFSLAAVGLLTAGVALLPGAVVGTAAAGGTMIAWGAGIAAAGKALKDRSIRPLLDEILPGIDEVFGADWQGPTGPDGGNRPTGGSDENGKRHATGCCVNIYRYRQNLQGTAPPFSQHSAARPPSSLDLPISRVNNALNTAIIPASFWEHPLKNAIIAPVNVRAAYGVVGIIGSSGDWVIPSLPLNTYVTLSIYDPKTGLYDPNSATLRTLGVPGAFGEVLTSFNPDTSIAYYPLQLSELATDSIHLGRARVQYSIHVAAGDVGMQTRFAFGSMYPLFIRLEDPNDVRLIDTPNADYFYLDSLVFDQVGTYKLTIAFGLGGLHSGFDVMLDRAPGSIVAGGTSLDTLLVVRSPYAVFDTHVAANDTIRVQAGVTLQLTHGMTLTSDGVFQGTATPGSPIRLRPTLNSNASMRYFSNQLHKKQKALLIGEGR